MKFNFHFILIGYLVFQVKKKRLLRALSFCKNTMLNNKYGMTEIFLFKLYPGSWLYNNWHVAKRLGAEWLIPNYWRIEIIIDELKAGKLQSHPAAYRQSRSPCGGHTDPW